VTLTLKERAEILNLRLFRINSQKDEDRMMLIKRALQLVRAAAFEEAADIAKALLTSRRGVGAFVYGSNVSKVIRLHKYIE
jgi:hypothetical protein